MTPEQKQRLAEIKERENAYCSAPGCGYPDGQPCIKCGRSMTAEAALKKRFDIPFLLTLLDQAQRDTERVDLLTMLDVEVRLPSVHGSFQMFLACPEMQEGDADIPSDLRKKLDAAIKKHPKRLDQAALVIGEGEK